MRTPAQIRRDHELASGPSFVHPSMLGKVLAAEQRLIRDIPDLLDALAERDAKIERMSEVYDINILDVINDFFEGGEPNDGILPGG